MMDLFDVSIAGFKRFSDKTLLKTNGKLVAIVGPNEAGKTSLLNVLNYLGNDTPILDQELSRGMSQSDFILTGTFLLSDNDRLDAGLTNEQWLKVNKSFGGKRTFLLHPLVPKRDISARGHLLMALLKAVSLKHVNEGLSEIETSNSYSMEDIVEILESSEETLSEEEIDKVEHIAGFISNAVKPRDPVAVKRLPELVEQWGIVERSEAPNSRAIRVLKDKVPKFLIFGEDERNLKSEYLIPELSASKPIALDNLCDIANVNISEIISAHSSDDAAKLTTIEHAANKVLADKFDESWQQSGVHVSIRIQGDSLLIQVVNENFEFTSFAERSDGLRQFVALQCFAMANWTNSPVLLIDEAEQRLHYDAQADLVQMLARQKVASKIIYTTHSAGCLPEDLGNGVRFVRQIQKNPTRSEVINKFWADGEPGFAPLLFGMGASTLAFFPTRNALMVEGVTDMLIMPSMIKEALSQSVLGFQIVPGLAEIDKTAISPLVGGNSGVLYMVDGDDAGAIIRNSLTDLGVSQNRIFLLRTSDGGSVELEDFIEPNLLIEATNNLLARFHGAVSPLKSSDLSSKKRTKSLRDWFKLKTTKSLPKVEFSYEILEIISNDPSRRILDSKREKYFSGICHKINQRFISQRS